MEPESRFQVSFFVLGDLEGYQSRIVEIIKNFLIIPCEI